MTAANPNPNDPPRVVPQFTLGDRLRKAREYSGLEMQDLAAEIDIHRQTVARYENGAVKPKRHVLLSWSLATGVDLDWIRGTDAISTHDEQTADSTDSEFSVIKGSGTRGNPRIRLVWTDGK